MDILLPFAACVTRFLSRCMCESTAGIESSSTACRSMEILPFGAIVLKDFKTDGFIMSHFHNINM